MSDRLPAALAAYRLLSVAATPLTPLLLARRMKRGKEHPGRVTERHGYAGMARPKGALVWLHGASVGELISVLPLIEKMHTRGVTILVTSGTLTSSRIAEQRLPEGVIHQFVPLDTPAFVRRFLDHWRPDLTLLVESDLWPNMVIETSRRGVPLILLNGRLSERSYNRWKYLPSSITNLLQRFDLCLARTEADAQRFDAFGARNIVTAGNLKLDVPAPPADATRLAALQAALAGRPVIAAASTHGGEEDHVVTAHLRLRAHFPGLLTLIAPRHPERGDEIVLHARANGLNAAQRSRGELPTPATDIYVADTVGELGILYRVAPVVFIGGSLVEHGGQNPIEAAKLGSVILHGPHVWNFAELYDALDNAHGAEIVNGSDRLTAALGAMLSQPTVRASVASSARDTIDKLGGALARTLQALDPYLMQLALRPADDA